MNRARNKGKICVSVCAATADEMIANIRHAEEFADLVEVRLDYLEAGQITNFRSQISNTGFKKPLIATYRAPEQGGQNSLTADERRAFWQEPIQGFWAADIEEDVFDQAAEWPFQILSCHEQTGPAADPDKMFQRLMRLDADAIKIAVRADDITEALPVWQLLKRSAGKQVIPIAMGEEGKWTRILGLAHGAYLTYASLDEGKATAEGQIMAKDLVEIYRVKELDSETKVYGVIGDPVSGSLSPYIHNAAFATEGTNAVFVPLLVRDLDAFMTRMVLPASCEVELNFGGFAVTMPHKEAVMKYLDSIDETAQQIGAVNTITIDPDGRQHGFNTDAYGFITPLKRKFGDLQGARVAVLGAGGAARACIHALVQERANVQIFARDDQKAASLASRLEVSSSPISNLKSEISNFDVLVNATPLGMKGGLENESPLTADGLKGVKLVFDLVTSSAYTPLIREAKAAGVATITGVEMLIEQGAKQFEIWTGREAPVEIMRASVLRRINDGC